MSALNMTVTNISVNRLQNGKDLRKTTTADNPQNNTDRETEYTRTSSDDMPWSAGHASH